MLVGQRHCWMFVLLLIAGPLLAQEGDCALVLHRVVLDEHDRTPLAYAAVAVDDGLLWCDR